MLAKKKDEFKFDLVIDKPSRLLGKSSEYVKDFRNLTGRLGVRGKKEETYCFRQDILGR